jgi:peroxiredoxin
MLPETASPVEHIPIRPLPRRCQRWSPEVAFALLITNRQRVPMRALTLLPMLLLAVTSLLAQDNAATDMLGAADSATAAVTSAVYDARLVNLNVDGKMDVIAGKVYMRRNRADKDKNLGMDVRLEFDNGVVITYNGDILWLTPSTKKLWGYDSTFAFSSVLGWIWQGRLLTMLFKRKSPFLDLAPLAVSDPPVAVGGVPCGSLRISQPDTEEEKGELTRWRFGIDDHLPRYYEYGSLFRGLPYADTLTITNMRVGVPLADSLFTIPLPAGYARDTARAEKPPALLAAGTRAPDWTLTGLDGRPLSLAKLKGRIVVLDFWYMACPPCLASMPKLSAIRKKFDPAKVTIVGVNVRDSLPYAKRYITSNGFSYSFAFDGADAAADVARAYHISGYPTFYIIGRDGSIVASHDKGYSESFEKELTEMIDDAVAVSKEALSVQPEKKRKKK